MNINETEIKEVLAEDSVVLAAADKVGFWDAYDIIDKSDKRCLLNNFELHYHTLRKHENEGGDMTDAPHKLLGFNPGTTIEQVFISVKDTALEMLETGSGF